MANFTGLPPPTFAEEFQQNTTQQLCFKSIPHADKDDDLLRKCIQVELGEHLLALGEVHERQENDVIVNDYFPCNVRYQIL